MVVVVLVVLTTAPEVLIAADVSVAAVRLLTSLLRVLALLLPERGSGPTSGRGRVPQSQTSLDGGGTRMGRADAGCRIDGPVTVRSGPWARSYV